MEKVIQHPGSYSVAEIRLFLATPDGSVASRILLSLLEHYDALQNGAELGASIEYSMAQIEAFNGRRFNTEPAWMVKSLMVKYELVKKEAGSRRVG